MSVSEFDWCMSIAPVTALDTKDRAEVELWISLQCIFREQGGSLVPGAGIEGLREEGGGEGVDSVRDHPHCHILSAFWTQQTCIPASPCCRPLLLPQSLFACGNRPGLMCRNRPHPRLSPSHLSSPLSWERCRGQGCMLIFREGLCLEGSSVPSVG